MLILKNRRPSLFWLFQISGWLAYWASQLLTSTAIEGWTQSAFVVNTTCTVGGFILTLLLRAVFRKFNNRPFSLGRLLAITLVISIVGANLLLGAVYLLRSSGWAGNITWLRANALMEHLAAVFSLTVTYIGWTALYFGIKFWQQWNRQRERARRAEALAETAQLQMLRYRMNPHFLFNSLSSIRALIGENKRAAQAFVTDLAEFLRFSLVSRNHPQVPLRSEVDAIRHYLAVEQRRYEDKFVAAFDIDSTAEDYPFPSFLLHPLVENAVRFGLETSPPPLRIQVKAAVASGVFRIEVTNSGRWIEPLPSRRGTPIGGGLDHVRKRLQDYAPGRHRLEVFEKDASVHAILEIREQP
jgi:two-component system LytT family sensor kinase